MTLAQQTNYLSSYVPASTSLAVMPYQYAKQTVPRPAFAADMRVYPGLRGLGQTLGPGVAAVATLVLGGAALLWILKRMEKA